MRNLIRNAQGAEKTGLCLTDIGKKWWWTRLLSVLIILLTLGVGNVWGAEITIAASDFTGWTTSREAQSQTISGFTIATTDGMRDGSNAHIRLYSGATHTITSSVGNITSIVFTCTANGTNNYGPGKMSGSGYTAGTGKTGTWSGNSATVTLSGGQARVTQMVITYTAAASYTVSYNNNGGSGTMSDGTGASITLASCTFTAPSGCKQFKEWNTSSSGSGGTSYDPGDVVTADLTLYAIWEDIPTYTVTLMDDTSNPLTQPNCSTGVTLPSRAGCTNYTFAGWTKSWATAQTEWTTTEPTKINAGNYTPTANENLYPVYTKSEGGSGAAVGTTMLSETFEDFSLDDYPTAPGTNSITYSNSITYTCNPNESSGTRVMTSGGPNSGSGANNIIVKSGGSFSIGNIPTGSATTLTFSCKVGGSKTLTITSTSSDVTLGSNTGTSAERVYTLTVSNNATSFGLSFAASGGNMRLDDISIVVATTSAASTTYYISEPNCCTTLGTINGSIKRRIDANIYIPLVKCLSFIRMHLRIALTFS